jgi:hypothetical protein
MQQEFGKILIVIGLMIVVAGIILWTGLGKSWLGRLPGDIHVSNSKGNFHFYFPFVTCLVVSTILTLLFWLFRR